MRRNETSPADLADAAVAWPRARWCDFETLRETVEPLEPLYGYLVRLQEMPEPPRALPVRYARPPALPRFGAPLRRAA